MLIPYTISLKQIIKKIDLKYGDHVNEKLDDTKGEVLATARRPSALSPTEEHPPRKFEEPKILKEEKTSVVKTLSSDSAISNDSSSGGSSNLGSDRRHSAKPQFYFGQTVPSSSSVVKSSPFFDQQPSAIEKVKKNEALTHPKLVKNEANKKESNNNRQVRASADVINKPNVIKVIRNKPESVSPSLSSTVSSLSSPTSSSSSSSSSMTKQRLQQHNLKNVSQG